MTDINGNKLPTPFTIDQQYLAAILAEMQAAREELKANIKAASATSDECWDLVYKKLAAHGPPAVSARHAQPQVVPPPFTNPSKARDEHPKPVHRR